MKPCSVNSFDLIPHPAVSFASKRAKDKQAFAKVIAAAVPFGSEPETSASNFPDIFNFFQKNIYFVFLCVVFNNNQILVN